jgi:antitoxin component HigA of HigAB toxin-antitoxin module
MKAKILKTEADYEAALAYVETLMDAKPDTPEEEELDLFSLPHGSAGVDARGFGAFYR